MRETSSTSLISTRPLPQREEVDVWLFDLDNTLYPAACNLFPQVERRMGEFICQHFALAHADAKALQKRLFHEHGTTLRGLMNEHGIDATAFLDFVHDVDLSAIEANPEMNDILTQLPGRKLIFTNADQPYSEKVLDRMGIAHHFEAIFDIVAAEFVPKPSDAPYDQLLERFDIDPRRTVFFEDSARNLKPAHERGMTTVWIEHDAPWSRAGLANASADTASALPDWVHHRGDDLRDWLRALP